MKITKKVTINKPAELVWDLIAHQFDKAHLWMDPIPHSYEIGSGHSSTGAPMEGRICNLSKNPNVLRLRSHHTVQRSEQISDVRNHTHQCASHCASEKESGANDGSLARCQQIRSDLVCPTAT